MQILHNKHKLLEVIEQESSQPLTPDRVRNLDILGGAYDALCLIAPDEEEHEGYASRAGQMDAVKHAAPTHP